jgi:2-dehydro-3-deoxy-D-arabinonate dehydratase
MKVFKTTSGPIVFHENKYFLSPEDWDKLINRENLFDHLLSFIKKSNEDSNLADKIITQLLPPIGKQEVWAAGVTYFRSREARMEESQHASGGDFYDRVYAAERPELFFKANPHRVVGHQGIVYIRKDSAWNVPEPELTLFIEKSGTIQGYTVGNDMSSRSIEGENPLYLPQAKTYQHSAALGPCLYIPQEPISPGTTIAIDIRRSNKSLYRDSIKISSMKRRHDELVSYLFLECDFPDGCFLMTGTGLVPPTDVTLRPGDVVDIHIDEIGTLTNIVGTKPSFGVEDNF